MKTKEISRSWNDTTISLIPKELQDLSNVKNYRPISFLNNDYKIFASVIAERLKKIKHFVGDKQSGVLPNRQIKDNLRVVIDPIEYYDKHPAKEAIFFFVDVEKAFDNLKWDFMFLLILKMKFGGLIKMIKAIYCE